MKITLEIIEGPDVRTDEDGWEHYAYTVRLDRTNHLSMTVPWRQGTGITDDPDAASVLEALVMDAATIENADTFEEWAPDLGYDPDSRKAEEIYRQACKQTNDLRILLGGEYRETVFPEAPDYDSDKAIKRLVAPLSS